MSRSRAPEDTNPDLGSYRGRVIARRFVSPDGFVVLVGKGAADNDILTVRLATPQDFWLHVAGESGSHVVIRNPDGLERLPKTTIQFAARLAAGYSKARYGGQVAVHLARRRDVHKPDNYAPGKVSLKRFDTVMASPLRGDDDGS